MIRSSTFSSSYVWKEEEFDSGTVDCRQPEAIEERWLCVLEGARKTSRSIGHRNRTERVVPVDLDA